MLTTREGARENLRHISGELDSTLAAQGHDTEWELYFNQDEETREQIKEVLYQKLEDEGLFKAMKIFITLINSKVDSISLEKLPFVGVETKAQLEAAIKGWVKRQYAELERLILAAADTPYAGDVDVGSAVAAIHTEIVNDCRKVLLLAHSQGNFYANAIWDGIYPKPLDKYRVDQFRIVGIVGLGSPASRVGNDLASGLDSSNLRVHVNHEGDIVKVILDTLGLRTLSATTNAGTSDPTAHALIDTYFGVPEVHTQVTQKVAHVAENLEPWALTRQGVSSSAIASAGYNDFNELLDIEFTGSGSEYRYEDVPAPVYQSMLSASSVGTYFNANVRNNYSTRKIYP